MACALRFRVAVISRLLTRLHREDGLINTTDVLVATVATVTLAAGISSSMLGAMDESRYGKAQPDAQALAMAVTEFYKDTGKWPGQAEHAAITGETKPPLFLVSAGVTDLNDLPASHELALSTATALCGGTSLFGFSGATIAAGDLQTATRLDINDYLVRMPDRDRYPDWEGPYLQEEIGTDPWHKGWVLNLQPLYCAEHIVDADGVASALTGGALGYAWIISGGVNGTISTKLTESKLDPQADDAGTNIGKLVMRGPAPAEIED
jgi:hypothetical protein